jgi:hypothetical protein
MVIVTDALAAFYVWTVLRYWVPFVIPDRAALLLFGVLAYDVVISPWALARNILAVAGLILAFITVAARAGLTVPDPPSWRVPLPPRPRIPRRRRQAGTRLPRI